MWLMQFWSKGVARAHSCAPLSVGGCGCEFADGIPESLFCTISLVLSVCLLLFGSKILIHPCQCPIRCDSIR